MKQQAEYDPIMSNIATASVVVLAVLIAGMVACAVYIGIQKRRKLRDLGDRKKGWK